MKTLQTITEGKVVVTSDTPAVAAYLFIDEGLEHGVITEDDVNPDVLTPTLADFAIGDEVFFQSPDAKDCLDDHDDFAAEESRIWFLGAIIAQAREDAR